METVSVYAVRQGEAKWEGERRGEGVAQISIMLIKGSEINNKRQWQRKKKMRVSIQRPRISLAASAMIYSRNSAPPSFFLFRDHQPNRLYSLLM